MRNLPREYRIVDRQTIDVNRDKPQLLSKHAQAEIVVGIDIDLADFTMPTARTQGLQTQFDVSPRQGIQHDGAPLASGRRHHFAVPIELKRIVDAGNTLDSQPLVFAFAADGSVDFRAYRSRQRDGGLPDASHA